MRWKASTKEPRVIDCEIVFDEKAGYYLYTHEDGIGIDDDLQDTLQFAMQTALEEFGVPLDAWRQVE